MSDQSYSSIFSAPEIVIGVNNFLPIDIDAQGWKIISSTSDNPIDLNDLKTPGNYQIRFYNNGPNMDDIVNVHICPINIIIYERYSVITQTFNVEYYVYQRTLIDDVYDEWTDYTEDTIIYRSSAVPTSAQLVKSVLWLDISNINEPILKRYNGNIWTKMITDDMLLESIYDINEKETDLFNYAMNALNKNNLTFTKIAVASSNIKSKIFASAYNSTYSIISTIDGDVLKTTGSLSWTKTLIPHNDQTHYLLNTIGTNFIAIDSTLMSNKILVSDNNVTTWIEYQLPVTNYWLSTACSLDYVILLGSNGKILVSDNTLMKWKEYSLPSIVLDGKVIYSENMFIILGNDNSIMYISKNNGSTWTSVGLPSVVLTDKIVDFIYVTGKCYILLTSGLLYNTVNWIDWNETNPNTSKIYNKIYNYKNLIVLISDTLMQYSYDGAFWFTYDIPNVTKYTIIPYKLGLLISLDSTILTNNAYIFKSLTLSDRLSYHIDNMILHISDNERNNYNSRKDVLELDNDVLSMIDIIENDTDIKSNELSATSVSDLNTDSTDFKSITDIHINNTNLHIIDEERALWNTKVDQSHTHLLDNNIEIDASKIVSGVINIERLPKDFFNNVYTVYGLDGLNALTRDDVSNGDTVRVINTININNNIPLNDIVTAASYIDFTLHKGDSNYINAYASYYSHGLRLRSNDPFYATFPLYTLDGIYWNNVGPTIDSRLSAKSESVRYFSPKAFSLKNVSYALASSHYHGEEGGYAVSVYSFASTTNIDPAVLPKWEWGSVSFVLSGKPWTRDVLTSYGVYDTLNFTLDIDDADFIHYNESTRRIIALKKNSLIYMTALQQYDNNTNYLLTPTQLPYSLDWSAILYGKYGYVITASNSNIVLQSINGTVWTSAIFDTTDRFDIAFTNTDYIYIAGHKNDIEISTNFYIYDNINGWVKHILPIGGVWTSICVGDSHLVLNGYDNNTVSKGIILISGDNGNTWIERHPGISTIFKTISYLEINDIKNFIAITDNSHKIGTFTIDDIYHTSLYMVIGDNYDIKLKHNKHYIDETYPVQDTLFSTNMYNPRLCANNYFFICKSEFDLTLLKSTDGITWNKAGTMPSACYDMIYHNGYYFALVRGSVLTADPLTYYMDIKKSNDLIVWETVLTNTTYDKIECVGSIIYISHSKYAYTGPYIKSSNDGISWETITPIVHYLYEFENLNYSLINPISIILESSIIITAANILDAVGIIDDEPIDGPFLLSRLYIFKSIDGINHEFVSMLDGYLTSFIYTGTTYAISLSADPISAVYWKYLFPLANLIARVFVSEDLDSWTLMQSLPIRGYALQLTYIHNTIIGIYADTNKIVYSTNNGLDWSIDELFSEMNKDSIDLELLKYNYWSTLIRANDVVKYQLENIINGISKIYVPSDYNHNIFTLTEFDQYFLQKMRIPAMIVNNGVGLLHSAYAIYGYLRFTAIKEQNLEFSKYDNTTAALIHWANITDRPTKRPDAWSSYLYNKTEFVDLTDTAKNSITNQTTEKVALTNAEISLINTGVTSHIANNDIHVSAVEKTLYNDVISPNHTHLSDNKVEIDASKVVTGIFDIDRIPDAAIARLIVLPYKSDLYKLKSTEINNADNIKVLNLPEIITIDTPIHGYSLTYGKGLYVAIGYDSDTIITSPDGSVWTQRTAPGIKKWEAIIYDNGLFVAVAYNSDSIAISSDSVTWTEIMAPIIANWYDIAYGNGTYVIISDSNTILTSYDGIVWTQRNTGIIGDWVSITFWNTQFIAIGNNSNMIIKSVDGITWTSATLPITKNWISIAQGNGIYVAVTTDSTDIVISNDNGITWLTGVLPVSATWISIVYGDRLFVIVAQNSSFILTSPDGITWTQHLLASLLNLTNMVYGNNQFVALASDTKNSLVIPAIVDNIALFKVIDNTNLDSDKGYIRYMSDTAAKVPWSGVTDKPTTISTLNITDAYTKPEVDVIVNGLPNTLNIETDNIFKTKDDIISLLTTNTTLHTNETLIHLTSDERTIFNAKVDNTHQHTVGSNSVKIDASKVVSGVISINRLPAAVMDKLKIVIDNISRYALTVEDVQNGDVVAVYNPIELHDITIGSNVIYSWRSICYGNGLFIVISDTGSAISSNGTNWSYYSFPITATWVDSCYGNDMYIIIGSNINYYLTSSDGMTWAQRTLPSSSNWTSITYGNGVFVIVTSGSDVILTSPDGITWTTRNTTFSSTWIDIIYANNLFIAISNTGSTNIMTSTNGSTWSLAPTIPVTLALTSITYGHGKYIIVTTNSNIILVSVDGQTWSQQTLPLISTWSNIAYGDGLFTIISKGSLNILLSEDGISWIQRSALAIKNWSTLYYGNGLFIATYPASIAMTMNLITIQYKTSWYKVVDDTKLNISDGYFEFISTAYSQVLWEMVVQNANTLSEYGITNAYTKNEFNTLLTNTYNPLITSTNILLENQKNKFTSDLLTNAVQEQLIRNKLMQINSSSFIYQNIIEFVTVPYAVWTCITFGNGLFVTFSSTLIGISLNGITWTTISSPLNVTWSCATYGNGLFIAFSSGSSTYITSPDGITWTQRILTNNYAWISVIYGNGIFILIPYGIGAILTSVDGITWSSTTPRGSSTTTLASFYANGKFVTVGKTTSSRLSSAISPASGSVTASILSYTEYSWRAITFGNGVYVAITDNLIATSPDSTTPWTIQNTPLPLSLTNITFGNSSFIITIKNSKYTLTSIDGITWELYLLPAVTSTISMVYGNNKLIGVGTGSSFLEITCSPNTYEIVEYDYADATTTLVNKTITGQTPSVYSSTMIYVNGIFLVPAINTAYILTSFDGITWTSVLLPISATWKSICYGNGVIVLISSGTSIAISGDSVKWSLITSPFVMNNPIIAYGNGLFIIISSANSLYMTSTDGIIWTTHSLPITSTWNSIAYGNGKFALISTGADILTSSDGITWVIQANSIVIGNGQICYGNSGFVITSTNSTNIIKSYDGTAWNTTSIPIPTTCEVITYGNGLFIAVSSNLASIITSPSGEIWTVMPMSNLFTPYNICYGNGLFIITPKDITGKPKIINYGTQYVYKNFITGVNTVTALNTNFNTTYNDILIDLS